MIFEQIVYVWGEVGVVVVLAIEVDALTIERKGMHQIVEMEQTYVAEGRKKDKLCVGMALHESSFLQEGGEPDFVCRLLVPEVIVEDFPIGGTQWGTVAVVKGAETHGLA